MTRWKWSVQYVQTFKIKQRLRTGHLSIRINIPPSLRGVRARVLLSFMFHLTVPFLPVVLSPQIYICRSNSEAVIPTSGGDWVMSWPVNFTWDSRVVHAQEFPFTTFLPWLEFKRTFFLYHLYQHFSGFIYSYTIWLLRCTSSHHIAFSIDMASNGGCSYS